MQEPRPEQYNPPLDRWAQAWRLVLCVAISGLTWSQVAAGEWQQMRWLFWTDLLVGLASFGLMSWRRRWPFPVAVVLSVMQAVSGSSSGPSTLAAVSLATRRRMPQVVVVGIVAVVFSQLFTYLAPQKSNDPPWLNFTFIVVVTVAMLIFGMYVGSRRELLWSLRERADQAERQQELRAAQARALERERIAREMHDVLAHRLTLLSMHAGALAFRTDLPPRQVAETADLIAATAHDALVDLREVLGTLRESEPTRPQPTLAELADLVGEAADSGMDVTLASTLTTDAVPDRLGRTVYRLVQEALTNARKHAPGAPVDVDLSGNAGGELRVRVRNARAVAVPARAGRSAERPAPPPGAGLGLVGMRERVELAGGHLEVHEEAGTFALEGRLPWP